MKLFLSQGAMLGGLPAIISGIVFWGMVIVGLIAIALISQEQESSFIHQLELNAQVLAARTEELLEQSHNRQPLIQHKEALIDLIEREMPLRGFLGATLFTDNYQLVVGEPPDNSGVLELSINVHIDSKEEPNRVVGMYFYYPNLDEYLLQKRNNLFLSIGGTVFLFGFILQLILQRVLSKPIMDMVHVASRFGAGETEVRFDTSRRDELGYMASFINTALDKMVDEQQATRQALDKLNESQLALREQHDLLEVRVAKR